MGCVQQAVLEFDEEVRSPWRPRLVAEVEADMAPTAVRSASRRASSRVGVCESVVSGVVPVRRGSARRVGSLVEPSVAAASVRSRVESAGAVTRPVRVSRPALARRTPVRLRLTRRARRLAFVLAVGVGVALGSWLDSLFGGSGDLRLAGDSSVVVRSGDTLWSIATSVAGDDDVRAVVDEIQRANGLRGADLVPGQVLVLP
jgi:nucleoid-associated protein YgaU